MNETSNLQPQTTRQPDVEVYIKHLEYNELTEWLASCFDDVDFNTCTKDTFEARETAKIQVTLDDQAIPVFITPAAAGKAYCSIWFQSPYTPWATDLDCAYTVLESLDTEIRCSAAGWSEEEEENSEQWWCVTREGKKRVRWGN